MPAVTSIVVTYSFARREDRGKMIRGTRNAFEMRIIEAIAVIHAICAIDVRILDQKLDRRAACARGDRILESIRRELATLHREDGAAGRYARLERRSVPFHVGDLVVLRRNDETDRRAVIGDFVFSLGSLLIRAGLVGVDEFPA